MKLPIKYVDYKVYILDWNVDPKLAERMGKTFFNWQIRSSHLGIAIDVKLKNRKVQVWTPVSGACMSVNDAMRQALKYKDRP